MPTSFDVLNSIPRSVAREFIIWHTCCSSLWVGVAMSMSSMYTHRIVFVKLCWANVIRRSRANSLASSVKSAGACEAPNGGLQIVLFRCFQDEYPQIFVIQC
jgi:hypothetical protein